MPKYKVYLNFTAYSSVIVEAEHTDAAIDKALDECGGAGAYAGNGSIAGLAAFRKQGMELSVGEVGVDDAEEIVDAPQ